MIMGQHFWVSENKGPYSGTATDDESRVRIYVDSVIKGMQTGYYSYLAHPDIINFQGMDSVYDWELTRLCKAMKEMDIPLEINVLGIGEHKHYPSDRFFRIASEIGNKAILGMDAHCIKHLTDVESAVRGKELAARYGLQLVDDIKLISW